MIFDTSGKGDMYTIDDIASSLILYSEELTELNDSSELSDVLGARDPATITTIYFPNLTSISPSGDYSSFFKNYKSLERVILPLCTTIGNYAFENCTSLTSIYLPEVTTISFNAFENCTFLTSIYLPKVTTIGYKAFHNCTSLTSISLPEVTTISYNAFENCTSLTDISNLPKVTTISNDAFSDCTSLTSISLPEVTTIGNDAFYYCTSLASIYLPKVTTINAGAFYHCTSLTSISLPEVTTIGSDAFYYCTSLKLINLTNSSTVCTLSNANGIPSGCYIQVPSSLLDSYKSATNWSSISSRIVASGTYSFTAPNSPSKVEMLNAIYPIGSIYMTVNNVSPASFLGGAWTQLTDRFLVGAGSSYSVNSTGGSSTHTHKYGIQVSTYYGETTLAASATGSTGLLSYNSSGSVSGVITSRTSKGNITTIVNKSTTTTSKEVTAAHYAVQSNTSPTSTLPPYLAVYMWKRVL
jgi:hypothetical protein